MADWRPAAWGEPAVTAYLAAQGDFGACGWPGSSRRAVRAPPPVGASVLHLRFTGEGDRHRREINELGVGDVCVVEGGMTKAAHDAVSVALVAEASAGGFVYVHPTRSRGGSG